MPTHALDDDLLDRLRAAADSAAGGGGDPLVLTDRSGRAVFILARSGSAGGHDGGAGAVGDAGDRVDDDPTGYLRLERHLRRLPEDPRAGFGTNASAADALRDIRLSIERGEPFPERTAGQILAELEAREREDGSDCAGEAA